MPGALLGSFGRYDLSNEIVTIGRSSSNRIVIPDDQVSGRHLQVQPQGAEYILIDLGSSNGTTVNGQRLPPQTPRPLRHGDVIVIGSARLTVEMPQVDGAAAFPAAQPGLIPNMPSEQVLGPSAMNNPGPFDNYSTQAQAPQMFPVPAPQQFPAPAQAPQPFGGQGPAPQVFGPPPGGSPQAFPASAPPQQPFGGQGPAPQGYSAPDAPGFGPPQGGPISPYPGNAFGPGQGYYPPGQPGAAAQGYFPPGVAAPPATPGARKRRPLLIIAGILVVVVILAGTALAVYQLTRPKTPPVANATAQTIQPFYNALEKQDYTTAAQFFSAAYTKEHQGAAHVAQLLQQFDTLRGKITAYKITKTSGSNSAQTATITVTRDPAKGTFGPDILQLVYKQSKWQIDDWTPGPGQG